MMPGSDCDSPYFYFLHSWDYRHVLPHLALFILTMFSLYAFNTFIIAMENINE
jgi:hypothetical protein